MVAFYNFFLPGLGYIVLQKRVVFGWLLLIGDIFHLVWSFSAPEQTVPPWAAVDWFNAAGGLLIMSAFAYDAYQLAKEQN